MNAVRKSPLDWMRLIFGIRGRVTRGSYAVVGLGLMIFKYLVEATFLLRLTGITYTPADFLLPSITLRTRFFELAPDWLPWAMVIWSLPFVWVAATMTVRRCADAGTNPWWGLMVLVPVANVVVMITMAVLPGKKVSLIEEDTEPNTRVANRLGHQNAGRMMLSALAGVFIGGVFAVLVTAVSVYAVQSYGTALFMGMPIVSGAAAGFVYNQTIMRGLGAA